MSNRTDIHKPSAIIITDYDYVGPEVIKIEGIGDIPYVIECRKLIAGHMAKTGGTYSKHDHGGNCMVCGSVNAIYTILFHHRPSNSYVRMGRDCAEKLEIGISWERFDIFKTAIKEAQELKAGKRKAKDYLDGQGLTKCWDIYEALPVPGVQQDREVGTVKDIVGKLVKYGSISTGQVSFLRTLLSRIENKPELERKAAELRLTIPDVPEGRVTVLGKIVSKKYDENWNIWKILVVHDSGWKVWGTCPDALRDVELQTVVQFDAQVTRSVQDSKFGIYKRPTKPSVV